jgi:two-component system, NarL family, nitrate/nitrite response regulator NarL
MPAIRLLLLDDHVLFREGLRRLLVSETDFETVAECGTTAEALAALTRSRVDIVLLDFDLEEDTGARFISAAAASGYTGKILMVTAGMSPLDIAVARKLGIAGIFLKHSSPATLLAAIRAVAAGGEWMDPKIAHALPSDTAAAGDSGKTPLTAREQAVLRSVFEGLTNKEIAYRIGASQSSVKATLQNLFEKTGVRTRGQLVRIALESSLETARSEK